MSSLSIIQYRAFLFLSSAILVLEIFSGCSSTKETTADHSLSASDIIASVNAQADSIQTFSAYGSITIETPTLNQGAGFDLSVKKPDSIRIIIDGPFGITLAKVLFTKEQFVAYNAINNTIYEGNPAKGLSSFPMMSAFPSEILMDAMSGVRRFTDTTAEPDSFYVRDNFYIFVMLGEQTTSKFTVDPLSMRISHVTTTNSDGKLLWEETYSYQQSENQWQPSIVRIIVPTKAVTLDISFDEVTINGRIESMLISIPEDAERAAIQ